MADEMLDPESAETQDDSQSEQKTTEEEVEETGSKPAEKPASETEIEFGELKGSTQDRIVRLVRDKNEAKREAEAARAEAERLRTQPVNTPVQPAGTPSEEEVRAAVQLLREKGKFVTEDDLLANTGQLLKARDHERLQGKYAGDPNGAPKYVSEEVEDYARSHGFGSNYEAAYKDMYFDELVDVESKKRGAKKAKTYTEKPGVSVKAGEQPLTLTSLKEKIGKDPEWWIKNQEKFTPEMLRKLTTQG